jgi:2-oxoglutarate/2-oxoacid ferredoxin oxidoreductase subunit alpha
MTAVAGVLEAAKGTEHGSEGEVLLKGCEAIAEAAIRSGIDAYFAYPITPQTDIPEYMAEHLPPLGKTYTQANSEISAINMVYGAAGAGRRCMTSSSSPGISLKQEGISYIAGAELPCFIVNVMRGGPGLGTVYGSQEDYWQSVKGGGHGGYRMPVMAPATVQECADLTMLCIRLADLYRTPTLLCLDGTLGQMWENLTFSKFDESGLPPKDWATTGRKGGRKANLVNSIIIEPPELEAHNRTLHAKYAVMAEREQRWESYRTEDADEIVVAFGLAGRIGRTAVELMRAAGRKVGLLRPISLFPLPVKGFAPLTTRARRWLVVEMNAGQMVEDVKQALFDLGRLDPVKFYGRQGGVIPTPEEIAEVVEREFPKGGAR